MKSGKNTKKVSSDNSGTKQKLEEEIIFYEKIKKELKSIISYTGLNPTGLEYLFSEDNMAIWNRAFTHITYSSDDFDSYEWLGDRILEKNLSCLIFENFPGLSEADYTHIKIEYIKGSTFSEMAKSFKFDKLIRSKYIPEKYIYQQMAGDIFESFFGALYIAGEKLGAGIGDVITRNVSSKMFTFNEVSKSYEKRSGPDITTIKQSMKQLTTFEPSVKKMVGEANGWNEKYQLSFPMDILYFFKANYGFDFVSKGLTDRNGVYKTIFSISEDTAKHSLFASLSDSLEKLGLTKDFFREKRFEKTLGECKKIYDDSGINGKSIINAAKKRMKEEGYAALLVKIPGKKGKKRLPTPIEILYGLKDTVNENNLPFEDKIPLLMHVKVGNENRKYVMATLIEEYAGGRILKDVIESQNNNNNNNSPRNNSPKNNSPRNNSPRNNSPRNNSPKNQSPKNFRKN